MRRFALGVMFSVFAALAQERDTALADLRKSIEAGETRGIDENIKQICRGPSDLHGCESWTAKVSDWLQEQGGTERYQAAIGMLVTVRDLRHRLRGANSENPEILIGLTEQRLHLGDQVPLQALVERAVALLKADKPESVMLARALDDLASVFDAKDPRRALSLRQEVVRMRRKVFPAGSVEIAEALNNLGDAYTSLDDYPRGIAAYLEGQVIAHAADPNGYVEAVIANNLGDAYHHTSDFPNAERYYKLATDLIEKQRGPDSPSLADALDNLASCITRRTALRKSSDCGFARWKFDGNLCHPIILP